MFLGKTRWATVLILTLALVTFFSHAPPGRADGRQVYKQTVHGVALIISPKSEGTGWLVDRQRKMMVTAHHVIADPSTGKPYDEVKVVFPVFEEGRPIAEKRYYKENLAGVAVRGVVLDGDAGRDLAVIVLDSLPDDAVALKLAKESPWPGDTVHAVGNPGASDALWVYNRGAVRQVYRMEVTIDGVRVSARVIETQNPINPGDSGGPLFNEEGEVVGVHCCMQDKAQLIGNSIDLTEVTTVLAEATPLADARSPSELLKRAERYAARGRDKRALVDLDSAIKTDSKSLTALLLRARLSNKLGRHSQALADSQQILKLEPGHQDGLLERAEANCGLKHFEQVIDDCTALLEQNADMAPAYLLRARANKGLDKEDLAMIDLEDVLKRHPDWVPAFLERAKFHGEADRDALALSDLDEAVRLAPISPAVWYMRAKHRAKMGQSEEAMTDLSAALQLAPRFGEAHELRGDLLAGAKLYKEALTSYKAALVLSEDAPTTERIRGKGLEVIQNMEN